MIKIGDFVIIHHPYAWSEAFNKKTLSKYELDNHGYLTGQVTGTYGPWEHMPESTFHWSIVPDCWILDSDRGSCQLEADRVKKDIVRSRQWKLALVTNDMSIYDKSDKNEYILEKYIIRQNQIRHMMYVNDTSGEGRYPVPV